MSAVDKYELEIWAGQLEEIADEIECNGFFACPGWDRPHVDMATCKACAARQRLNDVQQEIEGRANDNYANS